MNCNHQLPPGFRFHPTDEELIVHYLRNQSMSRPCPAQIISQVDIYKFDPWQLPEKAEIGENEWYFFTTRDRKYPNGARPNRAAVSGYWKATGSDKEIYSGSTQVGVKKALVFYEGRPPKGFKTDWIMHEYRLVDARRHAQRDSMKLDGWVLCRIYKKGHSSRVLDKKADYFHAQKDQAMSNEANDKQTMRLPGARSLTNEYLVELGHPGLFSQLLMDTVYHPFFDNREMLGSDVTYCDEDKKLQLGGIELPQLRAE